MVCGKIKHYSRLPEQGLRCVRRRSNQPLPFPFPHTDAEQFSNITVSGRDYLVRLGDAVRAQEKKAVTGETHHQRAASWNMWEDFLDRCGWRGSKFLDECTRQQVNDLLCKFAQARRMSGKDGKPLSGGYIQNTIGNVSQSFRLAGRADPRLDDQGLTYLTLSNLFRSYKNEDPPPQDGWERRGWLGTTRRSGKEEGWRV